MEAINKATFITVSTGTTHVGIGLNIDGVDEYQRFDICFMNSPDYWVWLLLIRMERQQLLRNQKLLTY